MTTEIEFVTFDNPNSIEFEPIPTEVIPVPIASKRYFGAKLPRTVQFFDCRWHRSRGKVCIDGAVYEEVERACLALNLEIIEEDDFTRYMQRYPLHYELKADSRNPQSAHAPAFWLKEMRENYLDYLLKYRKGLVKAKPVAIALTSFSIWLIADDPSWHKFESVPIAAFPKPRCGGQFFGVRLPRSVEFYDCRRNEKAADPVTPWGQELYGAERPAYKKGMIQRNNFCRMKDIVNHKVGFDTLDPKNAEQTTNLIKEMRIELAKQWKLFRFAKRHLASVETNQTTVWEPQFMTLVNYGYDILGDKQVYAITNDL